VITMTSGGMYTQKFSLGTLVMSEDDYDGTVAYARAKRARSSSPMNCSAASAKGVDFHVVHPAGPTRRRAQRLPTFTKVVGRCFGP